jgi:hypothetical protein
VNKLENQKVPLTTDDSFSYFTIHSGVHRIALRSSKMIGKVVNKSKIWITNKKMIEIISLFLNMEWIVGHNKTYAKHVISFKTT